MSKTELTQEAQVAIQVNGICKYYRLGAKEEQKDSIASSIFNALKSPISNFKKYRSLYNFSDVGLEKMPDDVLQALQDISFSVNTGERVGIIGSNGAGKSTLLKVLSRITQPTKGTAVIRGRVSSLLEVGTGFHPELSGRENIYLNATILGMRKSEVDRKFDEIVAFAGVEKFLDTPVKRYSSGMKVRLAFAVAANLEPEILIVDEVLAVGDAEFQNKCLNKMEDVGKEGRTVFFVSHNMGAISRLCDRVIWMDQGRILRDGNSEELISAYLNAGTSGHSTWHHEGPHVNEVSNMILQKARIVDSNTKEPTTVTNYAEPLEIEVGYKVIRECRKGAIMIRIADSQGNVIFLSRDTDTTMWKEKTRETGNYVSSCVLPPYLKPGRYHLSLGVIQGLAFVEVHENVLVFDISSVGGTFSPNRRGLITPMLKWTVEPNSDDDQMIGQQITEAK